MTTKFLHPWRPFESSGKKLEWAAVRVETRTKKKTTVEILVTVRKPGEESGPALVYPEDTEPTEAHAHEVVAAHEEEL
jgi:hypothetical protein